MGREKVENWSPLLHEYMHVQFGCLNSFSAFGMLLFLPFSCQETCATVREHILTSEENTLKLRSPAMKPVTNETCV